MKLDCHCHILPGIDVGAEFQRNLGSFEGWYDDNVVIRARQMEAEGLFDWLGTDLHNYRYADFFENHFFNKKNADNCRFVTKVLYICNQNVIL